MICFIQRKKPCEVIDKIIMHWVGAGSGVMEGIESGNGGEFSSAETREVASILNVIVNTTGAESPFPISKWSMRKNTLCNG